MRQFCSVDLRNDRSRMSSHWHSNVETKMPCFKLLGKRAIARDFDRQVTELHVCAAILNRFTGRARPRL